MDGGYVLDLSKTTFAGICRSTVGIDISGEKYSHRGNSSAKRLMAFWETEDNITVGKFLGELLKLLEINGIDNNNRNYTTAKLIVERLLNSQNQSIQSVDMDTSTIWNSGKMKFFISHRDNKKHEAKELAKRLESFGISSFVAHDSIAPMTTWKNEIYKALKTMDAFVCFITKDYYESIWTNQEIGFALAKNVPIFLYSVDKTDPQGFNSDIQAIKLQSRLFDCITKHFQNHPHFKRALIDTFIDAKDGSFAHAKQCFCRIMNLKFVDTEIDEIVNAINGQARYINQLQCLLTDTVPKEESKIIGVLQGTPYRDLLSKILNQYSHSRYKLIKTDNHDYQIIDSAKKKIRHS